MECDSKQLFMKCNLIKITSLTYCYVTWWEIWGDHITGRMQVTLCHEYLMILYVWLVTFFDQLDCSYQTKQFKFECFHNHLTAIFIGR